MAKKVHNQPTEEQQREYQRILHEEADYVEVRGKKWKVKYAHNRALDRISAVMLKKNKYKYEDDPVKSGGEENKVACKCAALLVLDTLWPITFFYWFLWRWFYYIKQYEPQELEEYIYECKKKAPVEPYFRTTILLTAMMQTKMQMNRREVNHIQAEQLSAQRAALEKSIQS